MVGSSLVKSVKTFAICSKTTITLCAFVQSYPLPHLDYSWLYSAGLNGFWPNKYSVFFGAFHSHNSGSTTNMTQQKNCFFWVLFFLVLWPSSTMVDWYSLAESGYWFQACLRQAPGSQAGLPQACRRPRMPRFASTPWMDLALHWMCLLSKFGKQCTCEGFAKIHRNFCEQSYSEKFVNP